MADVTLSADMDAFLITANNAAARAALGVYGGGTDGIYTDIASAATTDLGDIATLRGHITGNTTITSLGTTTAGRYKEALMEGALTLTQNATSLILIGAANITTAAGDTWGAVTNDGTNWRMLWYQRKDGSPLKLNALYGSDGTNRLIEMTTTVGVGTVHTFSTDDTPAAIVFGTTSATATLPAAGTYRVAGAVQVAYAAATITTQTLKLQLHRSNNTPAIVSGAATVMALTPSTALTYDYGTVVVPSRRYTGAAGDILTLFGSLSAATGAGTITAKSPGTFIEITRLYE